MSSYWKRRSSIRRQAMICGLISAAMSLAMAAPVHADERGYLTYLAPKWAYLTANQLMSEGHKVCNFIDRGNTAQAAADMVRADLTVNVDVASDIVITAVKQLGC